MSTTYMEVETSEAFVTDDVPETIPAQRILQGHDEIVWAMEVSGRHLFSASADKTIRVWDTMALRCVTVRSQRVDRTDTHQGPPPSGFRATGSVQAVTETYAWCYRCWRTTRGRCFLWQ
jgi:WD40 repeat protein